MPALTDTFLTYLLSRGDIWKITRKLGKAIADYSAAIRLDPKNPDHYENRARAWAEKGDQARADADFK